VLISEVKGSQGQAFRPLFHQQSKIIIQQSFGTGRLRNRNGQQLHPCIFRCQIDTEKSFATACPYRVISGMKTKLKTATVKLGRPPGVATKRINTRFPVRLAEKIEYAAALRGLAVAAFIQEAVAERADRVIEAESHWELTKEETANVAAMIGSPPMPNKKMLDAAKLAASHVVIRS
jgi:uncharacterized protein (DUF1778 family)